MEIQSQEARIILAIEAIRSSKKFSRRSAAKIFKVPETTLRIEWLAELLATKPRPIVTS